MRKHGQSFVGVKRSTVPKQSLSLREILKRYVRREPLPGTNDGIYEERFGDIEKISKADITVQMEKVDELKAMADRIRKREDDRLAKEKADREAAFDARNLPPVRPNPSPTPPTPVVST